MAATNHAAAVALAARSAARLDQIFGRIGGVDQPGGAIWRAYRVARQALGASFTPAQLADVQQVLLASLRDAAHELLQLAAAGGQQSAQAQLAAYGIPSGSLPPLDRLIAQIRDALAGAELARQQQIAVLYTITPDPALIIGDGERLGALAPGATASDLARWLTTAHQAAFTNAVQRAPTRFRRQAIATLSGHTTDCCLRVHGQVVELDQPFTLTGTPRFADTLMDPPFHHYCRTVTALVLPGEVDDAVTAQMTRGAQAELRARAQGATTQRSRSGSALEP